jgi:hypothetical protein
MDAVKPGMAVSKKRNTVVFWGFQSANTDIDQRFRRVVSLSYKILSEDGTDVTARFTVVGSPLGGIPIGSTVTDADDLEAAEIYPGVYAAEFNIPLTYAGVGGPFAQVPGRYFVEWTYTTIDDEVGTQETSFRLIAVAHPIVQSYAQVQDAIDEGIVVDDTVTPVVGSYTSARVKQKLEAATRHVARYTGRYFGIKAEKKQYRTKARPYVDLGNAVIGISTVVESPPVYDPLYSVYSEYDDTSYWIPNRHIRYGMDDPEDKRHPVIKKVSCGEFVDECFGTLILEGVWGWTELDGRTVWGQVPSEIVVVTVQIAIANIGKAVDVVAEAAATASGPVKIIKTFDQQVTYDTTQSQTGVAVDRSQGQLSVSDVLNFYRDRILLVGI